MSSLQATNGSCVADQKREATGIFTTETEVIMYAFATTRRTGTGRPRKKKKLEKLKTGLSLTQPCLFPQCFAKFVAA